MHTEDFDTQQTEKRKHFGFMHWENDQETKELRERGGDKKSFGKKSCKNMGNCHTSECIIQHNVCIFF